MKLLKSDIEKALKIMSEQAAVFTPSVVDGVSKFVYWKEGVELALDLVNTTLPPKDMLFPQTEKMYRYRTDAEGAEIEEFSAAAPQIIFGIRPCDVAAIVRMDEVFLTKGYVDSFYAAKRENLLLVAIGCTKANETCFCQSMGLNPGQAEAADIMLEPTADGWNFVAQSDKGRELAAKLSGVLSNGEAAVDEPAVCSLKADMTGVAQKLPKLYDDPMWDEIFRPCLGCGTCTFVCPTCYCFDINTDQAGNEGTSFRCWDSCMFSEYSRMAGGHNPRPSKKERVRNRYMHKLAYFEERYGMSLCVGCGRCIEKCPVGMDITKTIDRVREAE